VPYDSRVIWPIVVLTVIAALLRIPVLSRPMGSDEAATFLYYASHPLPVALTVYGSPNNHILHSALMHLSYLLFGRAEWALRLPAFVAGVAIVPLTWIAARSVARRGAILAASFAAVAPVLIDYSTDARGYTMLCCFALICTAAMARIVRDGSRGPIALFAVSAALGFWTVPVMLYPFVMLGIWGLITPRRRSAAIALAAAVVLVIVVYAPVLRVSGLAMITANPYVRPVHDFLPKIPRYAATVVSDLFIGIPLVVQLGIVIGFAVAAVRRMVPPMWIGFGGVIVLILIQRVLPFPRIWLPFLLLGFITAAAAWPWSESTELMLAGAVVVALAITGMATPRLRETGELRAVQGICRVLDRTAAAGDPVLALPPSEMPLAFYCPRVDVLHPDPGSPRLFVVSNLDYGQTLPKTLAYFSVDPRRYSIRKLRDFGSAAVYELRR